MKSTYSSFRYSGTLAAVLGAVAALALVLAACCPVALSGDASKTSDPQIPLFPSSSQPDNIVLARSDTSDRLVVTWRVSSEIADGWVQYRPVGGGVREAAAAAATLTAGELLSDKVVTCFSAVMNGIEPGEAYEYRVGSRRRDAWSDWLEIDGGPAQGEDCTFAFLGDTQEGFAAVGSMLEAIEQRHPDTSLYLLGGDLVEFGDRRNQWDEFLHYTSPAFSRTPMMPAVGNHDVSEEQDLFFSHYLTLPGNGLEDKTCKNYSFTHGNVFFIVLDSNYSKSKQKSWLKKTLKKARNEGHAFKVVMFHKPVYHPRAGRTSEGVLKSWVPLFDRYGVDLVLTGHDHSYARSRKIRDGAVVADESPGTVYVVANSSDKHYNAQRMDNAAVQFSDIPTYQVITTETTDGAPPVLSYRAYSRDGKLMDSFSLSRGPAKKAAGAAAFGGGQGDGNGVLANGRLRVEGTQLMNERGEPIQLRGLSSHGIHWYPQFANTRALLDIKERGANLFRVAMYADSTDNGYNAGGRDRRLNKRLLRLAVENSLAADLYTIIDWHLLRDENPLRQMDKAVEFFDEMSRLYANDPGILYEICNEPNGATTWEDISQYARKVIPAIRKNAPDAVIIVGTPKYSFDVISVLDSPLPYNNIMYAFHMYTGYTDYEFRTILDTARDEDLPVFVSEWGISKEKGKEVHDVAEGYDFLEYMRKHNLSWAYWALCNAERDYVVIRPDVDKLHGWLDEDLTIPGKIIFSALMDGIPQRISPKPSR